jgi:hypothetical protein
LQNFDEEEEDENDDDDEDIHDIYLPKDIDSFHKLFKKLLIVRYCYCKSTYFGGAYIWRFWSWNAIIKIKVGDFSSTLY